MSPIRSLKDIIKDCIHKPQSPLEILVSKALMDLIEEVGMHNVALSSELEDALVSISKDSQIRWNRLGKRLDFYCSSCGSKLNPSSCGKFECRVCDDVMMIPAKSLNKICSNCPSYKSECPGNLEHDFDGVVIRNKATKKPIPTWVLNTSLDPE